LVRGAVAADYRRVQKQKIKKTLEEDNIVGQKLVQFTGHKRVCVYCSYRGIKVPK